MFRKAQFVRKFKGTDIHVLVVEDHVEATGTFMAILRLRGEEVYSNLHEQVDGHEVAPYSHLLRCARKAAVEAVQGGHVKQVAVPALLAEQFVHRLGQAIGRAKLLEVCALNDAETSEGVCHSHDFCDANMVMDQACDDLGIAARPYDEDEAVRERATDLWNKAWDLAKASLKLRRAAPRD